MFDHQLEPTDFHDSLINQPKATRIHDSPTQPQQTKTTISQQLADLLRPLFNDNVIIPYFSDEDFRNVTFDKMPLGELGISQQRSWMAMQGR